MESGPEGRPNEPSPGALPNGDAEASSVSEAQPRRRIPLSGILLVFLGLLFLADTLNLFGTASIIADWWPAILIVIGLEQMINSPGARSSGVTLLIIGGVMLAFTVGPFEWSDFGKFWPVILVVIGAWIILKPRRRV